MTGRIVRTDRTNNGSLTISATALSIFKQWPGRERVQGLAYTYYCKALKSLANAVSSSEHSLKNETLLATLLLDFYEETNSVFTRKVGSNTHSAGAISLVRNRGRLNFADGISKTLVSAIRRKVLIKCMYEANRIAEFQYLWHWQPTETPEHHARSVEHALAQAALLKDEYRRVKHIGDDGLLEIIHHAAAVDACLQAWSYHLPVHWSLVLADTIPASVTNAGTFDGVCHVYPSVFVASLFNGWRSARITVQSIVLCCMDQRQRAGVPCNGEPAKEIVQTMCKDFCSSVPFHLGNKTESYFEIVSQVEFPSFRSMPISSQDHAAAVAIGGWLLFEPWRHIMKNPSAFPTAFQPVLPDDLVLWMQDLDLRLRSTYNARTTFHSSTAR